MIVQLFRYDFTDEGTFGYIVHEGEWWHSLELPWRDNRPNISCIPTGTYHVTRRYSPAFRRVLYWVRHVQNRTFILIHPANYAGDESLGWQTHLQGCITLGCAIGRAKNKFGHMQRCVFRSRQAVTELEMALGLEDFTLEIKEI